MKKLIYSITNYLDVISKETSISVKDHKEHYLESEIILKNLSNIWNGLSNAKKNRISKAYMDSQMEYFRNKEEYDILLDKKLKLPLSALIEPIDNTPDEHIIYDRTHHKFMLSTEAANENIINCWHFGALFKKNDETLYLFSRIYISNHDKLLNFLLQQIEFPEYYLQFLSNK